jgi:hypothetical protein
MKVFFDGAQPDDPPQPPYFYCLIALREYYGSVEQSIVPLRMVFVPSQYPLTSHICNLNRTLADNPHSHVRFALLYFF